MSFQKSAILAPYIPKCNSLFQWYTELEPSFSPIVTEHFTFRDLSPKKLSAFFTNLICICIWKQGDKFLITLDIYLVFQYIITWYLISIHIIFQAIFSIFVCYYCIHKIFDRGINTYSKVPYIEFPFGISIYKNKTDDLF